MGHGPYFTTQSGKCLWSPMSGTQSASVLAYTDFLMLHFAVSVEWESTAGGWR